MEINNNVVKVSIIVPSYNHEKFITHCIESIVHQTYRDYELIVIDDGSTDNSREIISELQKKYHFKMIFQKNKGLSKTLTETIKNICLGEYISICASDDFWEPNKIETQVKFMDQNLNFAMCYGNTNYIDRDNNLLKNKKNINYKSGWIFKQIITHEFHPPVNYMYRKSILAELGYFPDHIIAEDFYMNCLISKKYEIGYIDILLSYYRVEETAKKRDPLKLLESHRKTIDLYKNDEIYNKAILCSDLNFFYYLSLYKKYKILSIKYLIKSLPLFSNRKFIASLYHMFIYWR